MSFENSPSLDVGGITGKSQHRFTPNKIRGLLYALIGVLALIVFGAVLSFMRTRPVELPVGGLDGCVISPDGVPLVSSVEIGQQSTATSSDGCFFFAAVPPGEYQIVIRSSLGGEWTQTIQIISGQAVALGEITISR